MTYSISGYTRLVGLLGKPARHSRSPQMHNTAFQHLGLDFVYLSFEVDHDNLVDALNAMRTLDAAGFNLTMPNKQKVIPLLDEVSQEAMILDAVNTVKIDNGRLTGYNTDGIGYVMSMKEEGIDVKGRKFVVIGAGGAARSIAVQLALDGVAEIALFNRSKEPAETLQKLIGEHIPGCRVSVFGLDMLLMKEQCRDADVLVNTTNVGLGQDADQSVVTDPDVFHPDLVVSDIIYSPLKTKLLQMAEDAGCKTINGLGMLIGQGALAFKIWTGVDMPADIVKAEIMK